MAEIAGLGVSIIGLANLFDTCMKGFEYIQLGKNFGRDYSKCLIQLDVSQLRLARWAASVGLTDTSSREAYRRSLTKQQYDMASVLLQDIACGFEDLRRASARYQTKVKNSSQDSQILVPGSPVTDLDQDFKSLWTTLTRLRAQRQKTTGFGDKARWALYEKKKFENLLEDINKAIADLIELFPAVKEEYKTMCQDDARMFQTKAEMQLLGTLADDDTYFKEALDEAAAARGHHFEDFSVFKSADMQLGDINWGTPGVRLVAKKFSSQEGARLRIGNINIAPGFQIPAGISFGFADTRI